MRALTTWLNKLVKLGLFTAAISGAAFSQSLRLSVVQDLARKNYPVSRQKNLLKQSEDLNIRNLARGYLPQFSFTGQATYQSAVTTLDIPIPGVKMNPLSKDQYKFAGDLSQVIYDGGLIRQQQELQHISSQVEEQRTEVELYQLQERINQLFLGILLLDQQLRQAGIVRKDIETGMKRVEAQVNNGVSLRSNLSLLQAELLKNDQYRVEILSSRKGLIDMLGLFIGQPLDPDQSLEEPVLPLVADTGISRPELKLFSSQDMLIHQQEKMIRARKQPRASLFVQGGYGRPALNFLKNNFEWFYVGGVRLNWSIAPLYTQKNDRQLIAVNRELVDIQKETFLLNTKTQLRKQQSEIEKLQALIESDQAIISLRLGIKDAAKAQLENSVITATDYLREVNAEDLARQTLINHQLLLMEARINYQSILGQKY